jgi:SAM-dependent methyltransferase
VTAVPEIPGREGVSERLRRFVAELPWERESILAFVIAAAAETAPGAKVLDVGAGDAPYAELFEHADYRTSDWAASPHEAARDVDLVASADALPLPDAELDVVLCTQVLEHVPSPAVVARELHRVLRPGGHLYVTVPFVWELHELPHDHWRFTQPGLERLLRDAGFADVEVEPRNDCFTTVAQLLRSLDWVMGRAPDGLDERREHAAASLSELADHVAALAPLDVQRILPLGYQARAARPAGG